MRYVCLGCLKSSIHTFSVRANTPQYYAFHVFAVIYMLEKWVSEDKLRLSLLCEHIAILVVLVFVFPIIHNRIFSVRTDFMLTLA